jgi:tetratricopeptide (TPR) repeat protein
MLTRHILEMLLFAALLLQPLPAQAQSHPKMRGYLLSVSNLYSALEYEKALEQIARAKRFARTEEDDVVLSLYEGLILADMNRWDESTAAFKAALFVNPDAKLPVKVSPKVESRFESVRQQVRQELANAPPSVVDAPRGEALTQDVPTRTPLPSHALPVAPRQAQPSAPPMASGSRLTHPRVLIPAISGGVLMVAGGTSWVLSRRELSRLRSNDATLTTREAVHLRASRGSTYQSIGIGLLGAGVVGVGIATGLFLTMPTDPVTLGMSTDGSSAFVVGRWP